MLVDSLKYKTVWTIEKYANDQEFQKGNLFERAVIEGNLLLNEGITRLLNLLTGTTTNPYNNANARLGVGDSSTAEAASQTDLQAATNKLYKAMDATYPTVSAQTVTFKATFGSTDANWAWNEFSVDNGNTPNENLNRKVSSQGTKASGQTWVLTLTITLS